MLVDGITIANDILARVKTQVEDLGFTPTLTVITCDPNFETEKYLALKKRKAESLHISLAVCVLPNDARTIDLVAAVREAAQNTDGVVVQLPLPTHIDTDEVLQAIPPSHDVDAFGFEYKKTTLLPPVVGAIDEIGTRHHVSWHNKNVVIFGAGRLVGRPALQYVEKNGGKVCVVTEHTTEVSEYTKKADIIILGVGQPNLLTSDMVQDGVVIFDAGASEDGGLLVGDAEPSLSQKASLFTPVPGGIGPITIALLFSNLVQLITKK